MKLQLSQIQSYLDARLKVMHTETDHEGSFTEVATIETAGAECITFVNTFNSPADYYFDSDGSVEIKPILRPISVLVTPITINGEEVVPLIELAKIAFPKHDWLHLNAKNVLTEDKEKGFEYDGRNFDFYNIHDGKILPVYNQLALFDWLHKNLFDTRDLIGQGLAVSVHDIDPTIYNT